MSFSSLEQSIQYIANFSSAYLLDGITVVDRSCPQVPEQGEEAAPGDGEDRAVADRGPQQQPPQRVDDRREGLVLGEPAYPGWH